LAKAIEGQCHDDSGCKSAATGTGQSNKSDIIYIFHIVTWKHGSTKTAKDETGDYVPDTSEWHVYQLSGQDTLKFTGVGSDDEPRIYNKKNVVLVGIDLFDKAIDVTTFGDAYKVSVTQGKPQNQTDLGALISALLGITTGTAKAQAGKSCSVFLAAAFQRGTAKLPFDTKVTAVADHPHATGTAESAPVPGVQKFEGNITAAGDSCSKSNCVSLRLRTPSPTVTATIVGDYKGTLVFEVAQTGGSFVPATAHGDGTTVNRVSTTGTWKINTTNQQGVRVRATELKSGTAKVSLSAEDTSGKEEKRKDEGNGAGNEEKKEEEKGNESDGDDKGKTPNEPAPGVMTCTGKGNSLPCTTTRTFTSQDREWWDVSIGITTPGVREPKYSVVNSKLTRSSTLHTDFYGMLDLYPFAPLAAKNDWAPHFNVGVPLTSNSLYRPYFGMAESVGGLLTRISGQKKQVSLPLDINVFAGVTWMKTKIVTDNPTTATALTSDLKNTRVWKGVFGIEVPVSSIASKIKGVGSKNTNGSGKSSGAGASGT
jgi:hypothetical protein